MSIRKTEKRKATESRGLNKERKNIGLNIAVVSSGNAGVVVVVAIVVNRLNSPY